MGCVTNFEIGAYVEKRKHKNQILEYLIKLV